MSSENPEVKTPASHEAPRGVGADARPDAQAHARLLEEYFSLADRDKDGSLSRDEVMVMKHDGEVPQRARDAFEVVHNNYDQFRDLTGGHKLLPSLTIEDFRAFRTATTDSAGSMWHYPSHMLERGATFGLAAGVFGAIVGPKGAAAAGLVGGAVGSLVGFGEAYRVRQNRAAIASMNAYNLR